MLKSEVLTALGFDMLVGTFFEDTMTIVDYNNGDEIMNFEEMELGAGYILSGVIKGERYTVEGRQFFRYFEEGDTLGIGECILDLPGRKKFDSHGINLKAKGRVTMVYLPFKLLIDEEYPQKAAALTRLTTIIAENKTRILNYCIGKAMYNDEEFILKAFERRRCFNAPTKDLAKALNMNVRNLQRYLKKFEELGLIKREGIKLYISDDDRFKEYMEKLIK